MPWNTIKPGTFLVLILIRRSSVDDIGITIVLDDNHSGHLYNLLICNIVRSIQHLDMFNLTSPLDGLHYGHNLHTSGLPSFSDHLGVIASIQAPQSKN